MYGVYFCRQAKRNVNMKYIKVSYGLSPELTSLLDIHPEYVQNVMSISNPSTRVKGRPKKKSNP
jgi:hypothetical protein